MQVRSFEQLTEKAPRLRIRKKRDRV
jgi:hypothetical protein